MMQKLQKKSSFYLRADLGSKYCFNQKRDARVSFSPFSWGTKLPLIGQTVSTIIPAILTSAVWPIRGNIVPHENGGKLTLASLFWRTDRQTG